MFSRRSFTGSDSKSGSTSKIPVKLHTATKNLPGAIPKTFQANDIGPIKNSAVSENNDFRPPVVDENACDPAKKIAMLEAKLQAAMAQVAHLKGVVTQQKILVSEQKLKVIDLTVTNNISKNRYSTMIQKFIMKDKPKAFNFLNHNIFKLLAVDFEKYCRNLVLDQRADYLVALELTFREQPIYWQKVKSTVEDLSIKFEDTESRINLYRLIKEILQPRLPIEWENRQIDEPIGPYFYKLCMYHKCENHTKTPKEVANDVIFKIIQKPSMLNDDKLFKLFERTFELMPFMREEDRFDAERIADRLNAIDSQRSYMIYRKTKSIIQNEPCDLSPKDGNSPSNFCWQKGNCYICNSPYHNFRRCPSYDPNIHCAGCGSTDHTKHQCQKWLKYQAKMDLKYNRICDTNLTNQNNLKPNNRIMKEPKVKLFDVIVQGLDVLKMPIDKVIEAYVNERPKINIRNDIT